MLVFKGVKEHKFPLNVPEELSSHKLLSKLSKLHFVNFVKINKINKLHT